MNEPEYKKELRDFFNRMPCIVDMDFAYPSKKPIDDKDKIVQVQKTKGENEYTVYYFHKIYNDDRIYKCQVRFRVELPEVVKEYIRKRTPKEGHFYITWEGDEENTQLQFEI